MREILEFYVITDAGNCIYSKSDQAQIDQALFGGFLTALNSFSKQVGNSEINGFTLGKTKFFIYPAHKLFFVARTDPATKDGTVRRYLREMVQIFFRRFPPEMFEKNWDAAKDLFSALDQDYEPFFTDKVKQIASLLGW